MKSGGLDRTSKSLTKGIRMQKLRVLSYIFSDILNDKEDMQYGIEYLDDVSVIPIESDGSGLVAEQNKNEEKSVSCVSDSFLKTMCGFLDTWINYYMTSKINFVYCTTSKVAKESNSKRLKELGIEFKKGQNPTILNELENKEYQNLNVLKAVIIDYYEQIVIKHDNKFYIDVIKDFDDEKWKSFFNTISWVFDSEDNYNAKSQLLLEAGKIIKHMRCKTLSPESLVSLLLEEIEEKADKKSMLKKDDLLILTLSIDKVKLIILENDIPYVISNRIPVDPAYMLFDELKQDNSRDLRMKFLEVCETFTEKELLKMYDDLTLARLEHKENMSPREVKSFLFRLYKNSLSEISSIDCENLDKEMIELMLKEIVLSSKEEIEEISEDYNYPLKNKRIILQSIYMLFEDCYIAFKENGEV